MKKDRGYELTKTMTLQGNPLPTIADDNKFGKVVDFHSSGQHYSSHADLGDITIGKNFTTTFWMNMEQGQSSSHHPMFFSSADYTDLMQFNIGGSNHLYFYIRDNGNVLANKMSSQSIQIDKWYHVGLTFEEQANGITAYKVYLDNSQIINGTLASNINFDDYSVFQIGNDGSRPFPGKIGHLNVGARTLSSSEIADLADINKIVKSDNALEFNYLAYRQSEQDSKNQEFVGISNKADTLIFDNGDGKDTLLEFEHDKDKIDFSDYTKTGGAKLEYGDLTRTKVGNDVKIIGLDSGDEILIKNVDLVNITADDFIFGV